ncbi:MAG TPA: formate dehydrogenase accessory protein FdhE [Vicinamibacterales bacterium]|nr:formate dehydrogenase accessory protein FdhE [Vicinamibacterales bacterium]
MTNLDALRREWPAWAPWLAVVEETLREAAAPAWDGMVPALVPDRPKAEPLLAGTTIFLDAAVVRPWIERLAAVAAAGGTAGAADLAAGLAQPPRVLALFAASVSQDHRGMETVSAAGDAGRAAFFQALAALVPVPFLQACRRRWAGSVPARWKESYCPVCGAWPAFVEVCETERSRQFRCGRCGGAWAAEPLHCPFCGTRDHKLLAALIPDSPRGIRPQPDSPQPASHGSIDACRHCLGYVKALSTLGPCAPDAVMLEDLGSVDLDVAALAEGYRRPAGAGVSLDVTLAAAGGTA